MRELIERIFVARLAGPLLDINADAASLPAIEGELVVTTDSFTVQPLEFPGGEQLLPELEDDPLPQIC